MRLLRILAAMLFLGAILGIVSPAEAMARHRFLVVEGNSPTKLAELVAASLQKDSTGMHVLDETSCSKAHACGTPQDLVDMLRHSDNAAGAPLTVGQLAGYLRSLVQIAAPPGQYWMACKTGTGSADAAPKWDCMTRTFHAGETCFANPKTNRCVFARDCTNPVGREQHEPDCVELHVGLKPGDELHVGWLGSAPMPASTTCKLSVQKTGEQERTAYDMDECPRSTCDFTGPARDLGDVNRMPPWKVWDQPRISWMAKVAGDNIIRVPREVLSSPSVFVLCVVRPATRLQSHGKVIGARAYVNNKTYVLYPSMMRTAAKPTDATWSGKPYTWLFTDGTVGE